MPPKKKKSGKKKALAETDPVEFAASERVVRLELELRALRQALALAEGERDERHELSREWRARVDTAEDALEAQQRSTYAVTGDLARQYRQMRDQLGTRVASLEADNARLTAALEDKEQELQASRKETRETRAAGRTEVHALERRCEEMAHEFSQMLDETLERMAAKISAQAGLEGFER